MRTLQEIRTQFDLYREALHRLQDLYPDCLAHFALRQGDRWVYCSARPEHATADWPPGPDSHFLVYVPDGAERPARFFGVSHYRTEEDGAAVVAVILESVERER